jgi:DNA-binding transcriptional regulator of glucitol operon
LILSPRWIVWHVLTLGAMATCGFLAAWQWQRAGSALGSALNVGYGLQWPVFALFFAYMWWRMLRMEIANLVETPAAEAAAESEPEPAAAPEPAPVRRKPTGPSPFGPRPASVSVPRVGDDEDPELAEYNRMLAALAVRDNS